MRADTSFRCIQAIRNHPVSLPCWQSWELSPTSEFKISPVGYASNSPKNPKSESTFSLKPLIKPFYPSFVYAEVAVAYAAGAADVYDNDGMVFILIFILILFLIPLFFVQGDVHVVSVSENFDSEYGMNDIVFAGLDGFGLHVVQDLKDGSFYVADRGVDLHAAASTVGRFGTGFERIIR